MQASKSAFAFLSDRPFSQLPSPLPASLSTLEFGGRLSLAFRQARELSAQTLHECILMRNETDVRVWGGDGEPAAVPSHLPRGARKLGTSCGPACPKRLGNSPRQTNNKGRAGGFRFLEARRVSPHLVCFRRREQSSFLRRQEDDKPARFRLNVTWRAPARVQVERIPPRPPTAPCRVGRVCQVPRLPG